MSFADTLRTARSSPTARLHKFLTNYDPNEPRIYAFVEGNPDKVFYYSLIDRYLNQTTRPYVYSCEGKKNVYETFAAVTGRYPYCRNVLFFVDKDIDDIIGKAWPTDPRIFVTDVYSIENYLVCEEVVRRYFADFVKLKRVAIDMDPALCEFNHRLVQFQRIVQPLMGWIVVMRRSGTSVNLSNLDLGQLFRYDGTRVVRVRGNGAMEYLSRVTQVANTGPCWKQIRRMLSELDRQKNPKRYTRGKFEAWFLVEFVRCMLADLKKIAEEVAGGISVVTALHESNFVQLLVPGMPIPASLDSFLRFHLEVRGKSQPRSSRVRPAIRALIRKVLRM